MRIGIDLGGTKIELIAIDADGHELTRVRQPTPRGDYKATLGCIQQLVLETERALGSRGSVGVGVPGALSPASGLIKNANSTWCIGKPLDRDLGALLGREIRVANDANCLAVSESVDGAAAGADCLFAVILGTGVGGGIAFSGRPWTGRHAIAGEWGHNPLPWPSVEELQETTCYCGKHSCIEMFLSGPGFTAQFARTTGEVLTPDAIVARALGGDAVATVVWEDYLDRLARALAHVINILDPDAIVLGGGVSNLNPLYEEIPRRLGGYVFSDVCDTPILRAAHGDSSGVRGAAWLWS
ncbi:MAG: ROK family protein [Chromatiales bacterium]|nr:ROK family protein [Chromatiales bacterium]